jgi:hypothetical protein
MSLSWRSDGLSSMDLEDYCGTRCSGGGPLKGGGQPFHVQHAMHTRVVKGEVREPLGRR